MLFIIPFSKYSYMTGVDVHSSLLVEMLSTVVGAPVITEAAEFLTSLPRDMLTVRHSLLGAMDEHGLHQNGTEVDCAVCKTDLWLSAVVSRAAPGEAACPEHAADLPGSPAGKVS